MSVEQLLTDLESRLDPAHPGRSGVTVLAYGEISAALLVPGLEGFVAKRMSGFANPRAVQVYQHLVDDYIKDLTAAGITVVPTECLPIARVARPPVVYLLQRLLDRDSLGDALLREADDADLVRAIRQVLDRVWGLHQRADSVELAVDAQLSNWSFGQDRDPILLDVGTPFVRSQGKHVFDAETVLSAIPPGIRSWYRRQNIADKYMDDYFDPRLVAIDMLGNFIKEGAVARLPIGLEVVNSWAGERGLAGITRTDVERYYREDAKTLELFLKVRRLDRLVRRRILHRPYDFVLPGKVRRS